MQDRQRDTHTHRLCVCARGCACPRRREQKVNQRIQFSNAHQGIKHSSFLQSQKETTQWSFKRQKKESTLAKAKGAGSQVRGKHHHLPQGERLKRSRQQGVPAHWRPIYFPSTFHIHSSKTIYMTFGHKVLFKEKNQPSQANFPHSPATAPPTRCQPSAIHSQKAERKRFNTTPEAWVFFFLLLLCIIY